MRNSKKLGVKNYKRQRAPKYNKKQFDQILRKCRKLRRDITDNKTCIIVDNEKYFRFSGDGMSGNAGFYSTNKEDMPSM
jgi:hypothetical protein